MDNMKIVKKVPKEEEDIDQYCKSISELLVKINKRCSTKASKKIDIHEPDEKPYAEEDQYDDF